MKKVVIALAFIFGAVILIGLTLPTAYKVVRTATIHAKPEKIHSYVNDLNKWKTWMPWEDEDPSLVVTLGDKTSGVGANQSWVGKEGNGSLTFTQSSPDRGIDYKLSINDGLYQSDAKIHYERTGEETRVTWTMTGDMNFPLVGGYLAIFMDWMAGPMLEQGLKNLNRVVVEES